MNVLGIKIVRAREWEQIKRQMSELQHLATRRDLRIMDIDQRCRWMQNDVGKMEARLNKLHGRTRTHLLALLKDNRYDPCERFNQAQDEAVRALRDVKEQAEALEDQLNAALGVPNPERLSQLNRMARRRKE